MQVWVMSDADVYDSLKRELERRQEHTVNEDHHGVGFRSLLIQGKDGPVLGALLIAPGNLEIFQSIQWIHKSWQVSDFINFDALTCLSPELLTGHDYMISIPKRCLRSAGRGDLQTGPLLYEEMSYSESIQLGLAQQFRDESALLLDPQKNIFSGLGLDHDSSFENTIVEHAHCFAWDSVSGEVIQTCRRLAVRAGALYVVAPRHEYRLGALDSFLKKNSLLS